MTRYSRYDVGKGIASKLLVSNILQIVYQTCLLLKKNYQAFVLLNPIILYIPASVLVFLYSEIRSDNKVSQLAYKSVLKQVLDMDTKVEIANSTPITLI